MRPRAGWKPCSNDVLAGLVAYASAGRRAGAATANSSNSEAEALAQVELEKAPSSSWISRGLTASIASPRLLTSTHWQEPPPRLQEFIEWAERRVQQLRRQCSADALQEALADSTLFGPNPKPPSAYRWD